MAETESALALRTKMLRATTALHTQAHRHPFNEAIARKTAFDSSHYLKYLCQIRYIFLALETKLQRTDWRGSALSPFFRLTFYAQLYRAGAIQVDVRNLATALHRTEVIASTPLLPATLMMIDKIDRATPKDPGTLLGSIYALYFAFLSGGRQLLPLLEKDLLPASCVSHLEFRVTDDDELPIDERTSDRWKKQLAEELLNVAPHECHASAIKAAKDIFSTFLTIYDDAMVDTIAVKLEEEFDWVPMMKLLGMILLMVLLCYSVSSISSYTAPKPGF